MKHHYFSIITYMNDFGDRKREKQFLFLLFERETTKRRRLIESDWNDC